MPADVGGAEPGLLRVYTAPGEAADLQEMLRDDGVEFAEVGHIDEMRSAEDPAVLFLSRGLLGGGGSLDSIAGLPAHVVVVAADDGARSAATEAGRLFLAAPELAPGDAPLARALRCAGRHAEALLEVARLRARVGHTGTELSESPL